MAANARDYLVQVGRLIDMSRAEVHHNGDWFSRWSFLEVLDLTRKMTLGQITAREDFAKRIAAEKPVYLHECLYPLMQGWDSVEIRADVELGGTEQLFSLLVARDLQQGQGQEPQVALTMPILVGTDGVRRMGKSLGNYIGVGESAENQFGKIMSVPDEPMRQYFTLLTEVPLEEVDRLLGPAVNPRDAKEVLGKAIVAQYHGDARPRERRGQFRRRAAGEDPDEIPEVAIRRRQARRGGAAAGLCSRQGAGAGGEHVECSPRDRAGGGEHQSRVRARAGDRPQAAGLRARRLDRACRQAQDRLRPPGVIGRWCAS